MKIHKQKGMSLIGFIIVLALALFVSYLGMKIVPIYIEYFSVVSAMNGVASERGSANLPPYDIRYKIISRLQLSYVENIKTSDIKITRGDNVQVRIAYEVRKEVIGNLDVVAKFDKSVRLAN